MTDQGVGDEMSRDSRGAGGCMACRAVGGLTGGARRPVGAGADECVTAATVGTVGAPTAVGCGTGGATKVAGLA